MAVDTREKLLHLAPVAKVNFLAKVDTPKTDIPAKVDFFGAVLGGGDEGDIAVLDKVDIPAQVDIHKVDTIAEVDGPKADMPAEVDLFSSRTRRWSWGRHCCTWPPC